MATVLAFAYINSATSKQQPEETVSVLFVARDLPANHEIDPDSDLRTESVGMMSASGIARGGVKADEREALRGRRISAPLPAGVPLMYSHLASIEDIDLAPGMRAMTIPVDSAGGLGNILVPGDHVDVIVSYQAKKPDTTATGKSSSSQVDTSNPQAMLGAILAQATQQTTNPAHWEAVEVLTDVRVIAVGDRLHMSRQQLMTLPGTRGARGGGGVTLEVSARQALELIRSMGGGSNPVTLLLRPKGSDQPLPVDGGLVEETEP